VGKGAGVAGSVACVVWGGGGVWCVATSLRLYAKCASSPPYGRFLRGAQAPASARLLRLSWSGSRRSVAHLPARPSTTTWRSPPSNVVRSGENRRPTAKSANYRQAVNLFLPEAVDARNGVRGSAGTEVLGMFALMLQTFRVLP